MTQNQDLSALRRGVPGNGETTQAGAYSASDPPPRRWKTRVLVPGGLLTAALGILGFAARDALRPSVPVHVLPAVVRADAPSTGTAVVQAPGWVEPDPFPVAVTALADGIVQNVEALEGQPVRQGELVVRLVADDARLALSRAEAEHREKQAELTATQALAREAQANWHHPVESRRKLATAEASLAEAKAELARWPAEVQSERARLDELQDGYDRIRKVRAESQNVLSERELIRARQQLEAQKATVQSAEARKPMLEARIQVLEAELEAARQTLELRIPERRAVEEAQSRVSQAQAALERAQAVREEAKLRLERMEIRSPIDGIVMSVLAPPGSKLILNSDHSNGTQVLRLYDPARLQVRVDVPLADAAKIQVGQPAEIVVCTLFDRSFKGVVTRIVHEADVQKNTLQFKVAIQEPAAELKPEMLARVKFLARAASQPTAQSSIFVPAALVRSDANGATVWLVDQTRNVAELRSISPGTVRLSGWIEVHEGIRPGDWLIADAPGDLRPGTAVRIIGEASSQEPPEPQGVRE